MGTSGYILRATVQRNTTSSNDAHGHPLEPTWGPHLTLDCWVYTGKKQNVIDGDKTTTVEVLKISWRDEDVTEADRITGITDRNSVSKYSDNYLIRNKSFRHDHFEAELWVAAS
ncbi:hypothetical protein HOD41_07350 [bacterium]|jgi:hypothetical protein|nr:hypothetical protein [bacterium]